MILSQSQPKEAAPQSRPVRTGFTLVELLAAMLILTLLSSLLLVTMAEVRERAKLRRTKSQITRLNTLITQRWEEYQSRPIRVPRQRNRRNIAFVRLGLLRELMRMELPDRKADVATVPQALTTAPVAWMSYRRRAARMLRARHGTTGVFSAVAGDWTLEHEGAECLYLIVSTLTTPEGSALDFFKDREVGDVDGDGMPELLDGFGQPITFVRWAPGVRSPVQTGDPETEPDAFDPLGVDPAANSRVTFNLVPLIVSAGANEELGIVLPAGAATSNDPYFNLNLGLVDSTADPNAPGDNISNHLIDAE